MVPNRRYQKVVACHLPGGPRLEVDVISTLYPTEQVIYSIPLCPVQANEIHLMDGRFLHFVDEEHEHKVSMDMSVTENTFAQVFEECLNWIDLNIKDSWAFTLEVPHLGADARCYINWTFKDINDALMFRLTF